MTDSVPMINTLHSRAGSVEHFFDESDPNKVQIKDPTFLLSESGYINNNRCS